MSRRTRDVVSVIPSYEAVDLRQAIVAFLPRSGLGLFDGDGKVRWVGRMLAATAILVSLEAAAAITDRFEAARAAVAAMWPTRRRPGKGYSGFMRALACHTPSLLAALLPQLRRRVRSLAGQGGGGGCWTVGRWAVFGVDGSRVECPMTAANEQAFGIAGKKKTGPQQFLTTIFHVATGLIWDYRRGDARASERGHLGQMLGTLPPGTLLVADAGFTGYDLFRQITSGGRSLLIRVGSNVHLLRRLKWEYRCAGDQVYLWPDRAQKRELPPLTLRLITVQDGNRKMHLLTDVLDDTLLSDAQAQAIYAKRWGIELIYRSLKQTIGRRRLRCAAPQNAAAELDWAVVGLWVLGLMSVSRIVAAGHAPGEWSVASSLRVVRRHARLAAARHPRRRRREPSLAEALADARLDGHRRTRSKQSRHCPRKKRGKPPGDPKARNATPAENKLAKRLRLQCAQN